MGTKTRTTYDHEPFRLEDRVDDVAEMSESVVGVYEECGRRRRGRSTVERKKEGHDSWTCSLMVEDQKETWTFSTQSDVAWRGLVRELRHKVSLCL